MFSIVNKKDNCIYLTEVAFKIGLLLNLFCLALIYFTNNNDISWRTFFIGTILSYVLAYVISDKMLKIPPGLRIFLALVVEALLAMVVFAAAIATKTTGNIFDGINLLSCELANNWNKPINDVGYSDIALCERIDITALSKTMESFASAPFDWFSHPVYFVITFYITCHILGGVVGLVIANIKDERRFLAPQYTAV